MLDLKITKKLDESEISDDDGTKKMLDLKITKKLDESEISDDDVTKKMLNLKITKKLDESNIEINSNPTRMLQNENETVENKIETEDKNKYQLLVDSDRKTRVDKLIKNLSNNAILKNFNLENNN